MLPSGLFKNQRQLKEIDLPRNNISAIRRGVFRGASAVETLNLEQNRLERLEANVFGGLVNLKELKLARNRLTLIDSKAFRALRHGNIELEIQQAERSSVSDDLTELQALIIK